MKVSLTQLPKHLLPKYDIFIASASYEERSLSVMRSVLPEVSFIDRVVSVSMPHLELIKSNLKFFIENGFSVLEIDNTNQILTARNILEVIVSTISDNRDASFLIDISTFTRQTLLILVRLLRNLLGSNNAIHFLYTCAKEYAVGLPEREKWLSKGIIEVNSVYGYLGVIKPSRPYHLIILMGYELERAISLINAYEPSLITVGYGKKNGSISDEHYKLNKIRIEELICEYPNAKSFEFSCTDIETSKKDILNHINLYKGFNTILSPMNNKIATIACGLAAFEDDTIQISIAIPAIYNHENYSSPGDECYILNVPSLVKDLEP
ncbi:hypothetical protein [Spirosoma rhododendri]|uniref:Uncharacterized protein n=1 Tax=Spirosoma rhododendri TaxID=2728024 RepID=A0A7L5DTC1_9BACT|nr:hypothetical protein [Spirosoma rhododendri]QJD81709.1 hypothetical protein HH216_25460 [Spirosoma rhododendri]